MRQSRAPAGCSRAPPPQSRRERAHPSRKACARSSLCRVASLSSRFYDWIRHPSARSLAEEQPTSSGFGHLAGRKYCLLVTYKRSGEGVPTPVWFGLGKERLYVRTEADAAKVKRIRNDPRALVAPCTVRG